MTADRADFTLTQLGSGQVLAAGGCDGYYCLTLLASAETWNPLTGTWTPTGSMHTARQDHTATLQSTGKVLVRAGADTASQPITSRELYNPTTRTCTVL